MIAAPAISEGAPKKPMSGIRNSPCITRPAATTLIHGRRGRSTPVPVASTSPSTTGPNHADAPTNTAATVATRMTAQSGDDAAANTNRAATNALSMMSQAVNPVGAPSENAAATAAASATTATSCGRTTPLVLRRRRPRTRSPAIRATSSSIASGTRRG